MVVLRHEEDSSPASVDYCCPHAQLFRTRSLFVLVICELAIEMLSSATQMNGNPEEDGLPV